MPEYKVRFCDLKPGDKVRVDSYDTAIKALNGTVVTLLEKTQAGNFVFYLETGGRHTFGPGWGPDVIGCLVGSELPATDCQQPSYPKNNDGRTTCAWCGAPTRKAGGGAYDVCTKCGK